MTVTYTGDVRVGGPADVHELPRLIISKLAVGPYDNNSYLLRCRETGEQVLIDAAAEPERLLALVGESGLGAVITTHQHGDHWQALGDVVAATGATTFAGRLDAEGIPVVTDVLVDDGDDITFGAITLTAVHLVGHTPDPSPSCTTIPRVNRRSSQATACSRGALDGQHFPTNSTRSTRGSSPNCSTDSPTRPGSTPATAVTRL